MEERQTARAHLKSRTHFLKRGVQLMENGVIDMKPIVTATYSLAQARDAVQAVAGRTTVAAVVVFPV